MSRCWLATMLLLVVLGLRACRAAGDACSQGVCAGGRTDGAHKWCCPSDCKRCGGAGCGASGNGPAPTAENCCPARWPSASEPAGAPACSAPDQTACKMPLAAAACAIAAGRTRQRRPRSSGRGGERSGSVADAPIHACSCHGPFARPYRGQCLPSFMVIGSQKAATSKLRWYLSRHPSIDIPKEEAFHGGPNPVAAWDTSAEPWLLSTYLDAFEDVCNSTRVTGLKMPDYIVMSSRTIQLFHVANPRVRILVTLREPIARMYSYFAMQLRFGWSPINHMGKNPCMQRRLRELLRAKEAAALAARAAGRPVENESVRFTSEDIMVANLHCVRPCYRNNASGLGEAAAQEVWHEEAVPQCRNIYFTPLVHSMYALHLRRWLRVFPVDSLLLLRFDDIVLRPIDALQRLAAFLNLPPFPEGFKVEHGRENYTTVTRLLESGAVTRESLRLLHEFFAPHDAMLRQMFGQSFW
mmetsp:Transcript_1402/g.4424  ORF Transcript_1402/g.4424 Transcript_1402/m.4424 type:complete len:469 (-) Transcript_1402:129-1535(-)|eukprot:CAMPEP_0202757780 /NCGR_PEP_ID=MMETSP1388-20130828/16590_1 /ASSEMBLY_ACC=CAM_ASM_000864 /TAXON_ID=37098 /ORGANISM="Isochrysis sp, Strain CCMP1244" /LENGTH=468 /DNA_ID=CAMNT_0049425681 /DNA_START=116 /DNA_END=1522 /DNA_ORIENTATION=+